MNIRLISYEDVDSWILGKLTSGLADELRRQGETAEIGTTPDLAADINHHIIYSDWSGRRSSADTLMITHIDTAGKAEQIKRQLDVADMGICLSSDTMHKLAAMGAPSEKLSFINFPSPQQGQIRPHKISVGITSRCHADGSKREYLLAQLGSCLEPGAFMFHIMGQGWDAVIHELRRYGSDVVYHGDFHPERYRNLWQQLDYYLYLGQDEGSTGFLDAMEAGVPAITTPQGFHLDLAEGITYAFNDFEGLAQIFSGIADERRRRRRAVSVLSWPDYARKHLVVWREVLNRRAGKTMRSVTLEELESVGISRANVSTASTPWLAPMPAASGPGGAVHRPRLLLVADEPQDKLEGAWRQIIRSSPHDPPVFLNCVGRPSERGAGSPEWGLEVVLLDYRDYSDKEIAILSFDFDAVGFWNCAPHRLLKRLQRRSKLNYVLRYSVLSSLSLYVQGQSAVARLGRMLLFEFVHSLRTRSRAVTVSVWTRSVGERSTTLKVHGRLQKFLARVDTVFYTCSEWETELKRVARSFCQVPPPEAGASWEAAFSMLFKTMQSTPPRERQTAGLFVAGACASIARCRPWRKQKSRTQ